jgi:hypothetical protein
LELLRGKQSQRVSHQYSAASAIAPQPTQNDRKSAEAQISFCLAAAGWEPDEIDDTPLWVIRLKRGREIHQNESKLERVPVPVSTIAARRRSFGV